MYYSTTYRKVTKTIGTDGCGRDGWRDGMVTGNGENGMIESCGPAEDVMIFQNIRFNYPINAIRVTPDMSAVRDEVRQKLIRFQGKYLSAEGAAEASRLMLQKAAEWKETHGFGEGAWELQNTYSFHPAHQLRICIAGQRNGTEKSYIRYTDYERAEIVTEWTDQSGEKWKRRSFTSRRDNVTISELIAPVGKQVSVLFSIDDIADMSNEQCADIRLDDIRSRKLSGCGRVSWLGLAAHYPEYQNSELKYGAYAGVTLIQADGDKAKMERSGDSGILVSDAERVIWITKATRDVQSGTLEDFVTSSAQADRLVSRMLAELEETAEKYKHTDGKFDYEQAISVSVAVHGEMFGRCRLQLCKKPEDAAMRSLSNEALIEEQRASGARLLPAMMERLWENGRYAAICASGMQAPRLGGMWTGAWGCLWSGDYTTDANINLQMAGANTGNIPEQTIGFLNVILKNITDWEWNARQVYGFSDALLAPPRTDGDAETLTHFSKYFPGHIWNSGAAWLIYPVYELYECFGNRKIPLTEDIRKALSDTGNRYTEYRSEGDEKTIYRFRNTMDISDERAKTILEEGFFDLETDILRPLIRKTANFWKQFVDPRYYLNADGEAVYEEKHRQLREGECFLLLPGFSPENSPEDTGQPYTVNPVMDIAAARSVLKMEIRMEESAAGAGSRKAQERIAEDTYLLRRLPPYLYEPEGELKEWSVKKYCENYGHRHASQLYGLWPEHEGAENCMLMEGAARLIQKKNSVHTNDGLAGHGWLHRALVMARLKNADGVREALLPLVSQRMLYTSLMTAHNTDGTSAYCTDAAITIPAVLLEAIVYSNDKIIELLPALPQELRAYGSIGGSCGIRLRSGARLLSMEWDQKIVKAVIQNGKGCSVRLKGHTGTIMANGIAVSAGGQEFVIPTQEKIRLTFISAGTGTGAETGEHKDSQAFVSSGKTSGQ